jgi:DNA polymerase
MFGVPVEKHGVNSELRRRGKVATLALGYGGGESALVAMGALKMGIPEEDLPEIKAKWRQANPAICGLWRKIEDAAILCVRTGERQAVPVKIHDSARARDNEYKTGATMGTYSDYFNTGVGITFRPEADFATNQDFLTIELPTRRKLFYAHPQLLPARNFPERESLHYMSTNQTTKKWDRTDTWGGKLVENITQAVARDCLAETLLRLKRKGLTAVFHVHDEVIVEVDRADQLNDILDIMAEPLDWAPGLPLKGAGFCCEYYQKD